MKKILYAGETSIISKSCAEMAKEIGMEMITVRSGLDALKEIVTEEFALLVTSPLLEEIDGISLVKAVRPKPFKMKDFIDKVYEFSRV
jgi:DNA-binding NtrC family response regulator